MTALGTHQRDAPSRHDDGVIRTPTLCCWCCHGPHGRHVVMVSESYHALLSNTPLGRESVSRCSVDSRGSCIGVLVVVTTNSSASVTSPHRLVHLLLHDLRLLATDCKSSCGSSRCLNFTCESLRVVRSLYSVSEQIWLNSPVIDVLRAASHSHPRGRVENCSFRLSVGVVIGCPIISRLHDRHVPVICHVTLPALNSCTSPQDVRHS